MFAKAQTGRKLKLLKSDNGGKLTSKEFEEFLKAHGIHSPYNPQQNGVSMKLRSCDECEIDKCALACPQ